MIICFCPECNTAFEAYYITDKIDLCPKCKGSTFNIDEHLYPILKNLYTKGIETKYCCEGHWVFDLYEQYDKDIPQCILDGIKEERQEAKDNLEFRNSEFYIWFEDIDLEVFKDLKYSIIDKDDLAIGRITLRQSRELFRSYIDYIEYKFNLIKELYEWSERI